MFLSLLTIKSFCWHGGTFQASIGDDTSSRQGRFACVFAGPDGGITLERDRLGLNKLFLAVHESGTVVIANYLIDLVRRRVPFETIYSAPAGRSLHLDVPRQVVAVSPDAGANPAADPAAGPQYAGLHEVARDIRQDLEVWFARLAAQFGARKVCVCLSGGIDSGVIAALTRKYFSNVTAYTYAFVERGTPRSDDSVYAERLAADLGIPFRLVPASCQDVLAAIDDALCYGQDWRDFNVHCAIVNELVARAIRRDMTTEGSAAAPLVFTGDLANELLADYTSEQFDGREYYRLPALTPADLRRALVRGLDAGDREVGIFGHHGLDVIQPYGLVADRYLRVPGHFIGGQGFKQALARAMAEDLLPAYVFNRVKVRAQIGGSAQPTGILPLLIRRGYDAAWLRTAFCRVFRIEDQAFLNRFIRAGRYRSPSRSFISGHIAA